MIQTWEGAGELRPCPDAKGTNGSETILSLPSLQVPATPRRTPRAEYNPIREGRPCARCGSRMHWRQIPAIGDGWACCLPPETLAANHDLLQHTCDRSCLLAAGGAA